ncbi:hypothetical protein GGR56DRAFT_634538 [Xylariaceae sp. FL0804]|nr:hypothetical protein GGR56DRAFT_634538 [Xylariaceae sp. FL0804]
MRNPTPVHNGLELDPEYYQKQTVAYPDHSIPQFVQSDDSSKQAVEPPLDGYYKPGVNAQYPPSQGYSESGHGGSMPYGQGVSSTSGNTTEGPYSQYTPSSVPPNEKAPAATICGIRRRNFYIILVIAIVIVIGAVAGGVAGGLAATHSSKSTSGGDGNNNSTTSGGPTSSPDGASNSTTTSGPSSSRILAASKLTASNWTDASGGVHRTVFFQDAYGALIAARWNASSTTAGWATDNLTAQQAATTRPLDPAPGTPLASASIDRAPQYETHLWFLDPANMIRSMASTDAANSPSDWQNDTLGGAQLQTWEGGQLAAAWQRGFGFDGESGSGSGGDNNGTWVVAYQRPEGAIKTANSSTWQYATVCVNSSDVTANSSLALLPQLQQGGAGASANGLQLVFESVDPYSMSLTDFADDWDGADDRAESLFSDIPQPATSQQFAATAWDGWGQALYLALLANGTLVGSHWDGTDLRALDDGISFSGGPGGDGPSFSAIAMTADAMFYGIAGGAVLEYALDTADPSTFNYVGEVFS